MKEDYRHLDGRRFTAKIRGIKCGGVIGWDSVFVNFYQNQIDGGGEALHGYKYCTYTFTKYLSRILYDGENIAGISDLKIKPPLLSERDSFKNWCAGDIIMDKSRRKRWEVIFRYKNLIICEDEKGCATDTFSIDDLFSRGFRSAL